MQEMSRPLGTALEKSSASMTRSGGGCQGWRSSDGQPWAQLGQAGEGGAGRLQEQPSLCRRNVCSTMRTALEGIGARREAGFEL